MIKIKLDTMKNMNKMTINHYEKNLEKISLINQEILKTNEECTPYLIIYSDTALENYFKKVDSIASTVEGMESSVEYLDIIMNRIGKFL